MYRRDECRLCHKAMLHHQRDRHEAELCPERTVNCEPPIGLGCGAVLKAKDMREHCRSECPCRLVKCRVGCGNKFKMSELKKHEEEVRVGGGRIETKNDARRRLTHTNTHT